MAGTATPFVNTFQMPGTLSWDLNLGPPLKQNEIHLKPHTSGDHPWGIESLGRSHSLANRTVCPRASPWGKQLNLTLGYGRVLTFSHRLLVLEPSLAQFSIAQIVLVVSLPDKSLCHLTGAQMLAITIQGVGQGHDRHKDPQDSTLWNSEAAGMGCSRRAKSRPEYLETVTRKSSVTTGERTGYKTEKKGFLAWVCMYTCVCVSDGVGAAFFRESFQAVSPLSQFALHSLIDKQSWGSWDSLIALKWEFMLELRLGWAALCVPFFWLIPASSHTCSLSPPPEHWPFKIYSH